MSVKSRPTVLFVDDEPCMREVMTMLLGEEGYEIFTASDGLEALARLRTVTPDVIISDLNMPRMSGFEFLSVVRRRFPTIPVIAISGAFNLSDHYPVGMMADAFYPKGRCHPEELLRIVAELTESPLTRPTNYSPRQPAPVQMARSTANRQGLPTITLTCTECLRAVDVEHQQDIRHGIDEARCLSCDTLIRYRTASPMSSIVSQGVLASVQPLGAQAC
jgi:CheY-like chemotaxis protein